MQFKSLALSLSLFVAATLLPTASSACTDFIVKAQDGSVVGGRSLEWALPTSSKMVAHPRGQKFASKAPGGKAGLQWTGKHGYVNINMYDIDVVVDGLNEKGLSVGGLFLPTSQFPQPGPQEASRALFILDFGHWLLSNFATVDEVKKALPSVVVWSEFIPSQGMEFTAHYAVHDPSGKSIVIEFMDRRRKVYDNPLGVMTNAPTFDWQVQNLACYMNLSPFNAKTLNLGGLKIAAPGQGTGLLGLPGDWTPPSRFVKTALLTQYSFPAKDAAQAVILAEHILMSLDIPRGAVREQSDKGVLSDTTMWAVIKDQKNLVYYFRSYDNTTLRAVRLDKLNLKAGAKVVSMPLETPPAIQEMSGQLR